MACFTLWVWSMQTTAWWIYMWMSNWMGVVMSVRHVLGILSQLPLSQDPAIFYLMMQTFIKSITELYFIPQSLILFQFVRKLQLNKHKTSSHVLLVWAVGQDSAPSADFIMIGINDVFFQVRVYSTSSNEWKQIDLKNGSWIYMKLY